eukprot:tig00001110_g7082.t1
MELRAWEALLASAGRRPDGAPLAGGPPPAPRPPPASAASRREAAAAFYAEAVAAHEEAYGKDAPEVVPALLEAAAAAELRAVAAATAGTGSSWDAEWGPFFRHPLRRSYTRGRSRSASAPGRGPADPAAVACLAGLSRTAGFEELVEASPGRTSGRAAALELRLKYAEASYFLTS